MRKPFSGHLLQVPVKHAKLHIEVAVCKQVYLELLAHRLCDISRKNSRQTLIFTNHGEIPVKITINALLNACEQHIKFLTDPFIYCLHRLLAFGFYITVQLFMQLFTTARIRFAGILQHRGILHIRDKCFRVQPVKFYRRIEKWQGQNDDGNNKCTRHGTAWRVTAALLQHDADAQQQRGKQPGHSGGTQQKKRPGNDPCTHVRNIWYHQL